MGYTFDGPNKKIQLTAGTTAVAMGDLYSRWIDWLLTSDNSKYLLAVRNVGGDATSDVEALGITYFLTNGWRIVPQSADHRLTITGNLFTDPFGYSPVDTVPGYSIVVEYARSNLIDLLTAEGGEGGGLTTEEHDQLMATAIEDSGRLQDLDTRLPATPASQGDVTDARDAVISAIPSVADLALEASVQDRPTLTDIEASTILAKQAEIVRALGLAQDNFRIKNIVLDDDNNMTSCTITTYGSAEDATIDQNATGQYIVTASFSGPGVMTNYLSRRMI